MGREEDAQHAVLTFVIAGRDAAEFGLGTLRGDQIDAADFLRHQHAAIGQERDAPGQIETGDLRDLEGKIGIGLLFAGVGLRTCGGCQQRHEKGGEDQLRHLHDSLRSGGPTILIPRTIPIGPPSCGKGKKSRSDQVGAIAGDHPNAAWHHAYSTPEKPIITIRPSALMDSSQRSVKSDLGANGSTPSAGTSKYITLTTRK